MLTWNDALGDVSTMAFWFRTPQSTPTPPPQPILAPQIPAHPFRGWTESLVITGVLRGDERLSDLLNRREPLVAERTTAMPHGMDRSALIAQDFATIDPFDLDLVLGLPLDESLTAARAARRVYKVRYPVLVDCRDFEIRGLLHLFPGNAPEFALHHTGVLFIPVTKPVVRRRGRLVSDPMTDVALVNRFAVRTITQLDVPS